MQAWQIQPDQTIELRDVAQPQPGPGQVRVAVGAAGINRADIIQIRGHYPAPPGYDTNIPGLEYAGVIDAVGPQVVERSVGDRVMGLVPAAAYAEAVVTHERETLPLPSGLDFPHAATIPEAFLTAYRALFLEAGLQAGQWCLIRPATAAVGLAAVQLATALRARPVGSSRDPDKLAAARDAGLLASLCEDETLDAQLRACTDGAGVAVIMDMVGSGWNHLLRGLRTEGSLVLVGVLGGTRTELDVRTVLQRRLRLHGMTMRSQPMERRMAIAARFRDSLAPLFAAGTLQPLPLQTFPFEDAPAAHAHMLEGAFSGKRVLVRDT